MNNLIPTKCPHCGSELEYDGINLTCRNFECSGVRVAEMISCISILGIKGIGPAMVETFVKDGGWFHFFDIFSEKFRMEMSGRIKMTANVEKVFDTISGIKEIPLYKIVMIVGQEGIGEVTAKQIAKFICGQEYSFKGIAQKATEPFKPAHIGRINVQRAVKYLRSFSVETISPEETKSNVATGIEFTGSPKPFFNTKDDFLSAIEKYGYMHVKIGEASVLVTDSMSSTSSKMKTAEKKGIRIVTYQDFFDENNK